MKDINITQTIHGPSFGNGLAPSIDVQPGTTLISVAQPLLILVENDSLPSICSYCFLSPSLSDAGSSLKRCSGCKLAHYCSSTCQKTDWAAGHSKLCGALRRTLQCPPTPVRALMQMLLKHKYGRAPDPKWQNLESHMNDFRAQHGKRWGEFMMQAQGAIEFAKMDSSFMEMAVELLCRLATNAFRVTLPDDTPVGLCFEPTLALANHSCSPNAAIVFNGRSITMRAMSRIDAGEQIFISYVDPIQPRFMRQKELKERYFFTCQCEVCHFDENPYQTFLRVRGVTGTTSNLQQLAAEWWSVDYIDDAQKLSKQAAQVELSSSNMLETQSLLNEGRSTQDLKPLHTGILKAEFLIGRKLLAIPPVPGLLNEIYLYHLTKSQYLETLIILLATSLYIDPYTYPQLHHTIRVVRLYTIATLMKHIASVPTAELFANTSTSAKFTDEQKYTIRNFDFISANQVFIIFAHDLGKTSHGEDSSFMQEVKDALGDVEDVQTHRGDGKVGRELRRWMVQGDVAVEGKLIVETLLGGLKDMVKMIGLVVEGIEL